MLSVSGKEWVETSINNRLIEKAKMITILRHCRYQILLNKFSHN